jgi:hypothetical protein
MAPADYPAPPQELNKLQGGLVGIALPVLLKAQQTGNTNVMSLCINTLPVLIGMARLLLQFSTPPAPGPSPH